MPVHSTIQLCALLVVTDEAAPIPTNKKVVMAVLAEAFARAGRGQKTNLSVSEIVAGALGVTVSSCVAPLEDDIEEPPPIEVFANH